MKVNICQNKNLRILYSKKAFLVNYFVQFIKHEKEKFSITSVSMLNRIFLLNLVNLDAIF